MSALSLGAMLMGSRTDEATSFAILDRFAEAGGTFIDTSGNYAFWMHGALCKTGRECRPSGPARAVGAGRTGSNLSRILHNVNFCIKHNVGSDLFAQVHVQLPINICKGRWP